jgi:MFS family permease
MWLWLQKPAWLPGGATGDLSDSLRFAAGLSLVVAGLCLVIPTSPPAPREASSPGRAALAMLARSDTLVLIAVSFLIALGLGFVYPLAQMYFRSLGFAPGQIAPLLSLGQVGEIAAFLLLAPCLRRFGLRTTFLIGSAFWVMRFAVWAWGGSAALSVALISVHGFAFAYVFGVGQMYMHLAAPPHARASAQAVHMIITMGFGVLLSNLTAGWLSSHYSVAAAAGLVVDYRAVYFWPAASSLLAMGLFALFFSPTRPAEAPTAESSQPPA